MWSITNVLALIAIFDGSRRIFRRVYTKSSITFVLLGFAYCFGTSAYSFYVANSLEIFSEPSSELTNFEKLPEDWGQNRTPEDREKITKKIASSFFVQGGALGNYVDNSGVWKSYCPTDSDLLKRQEKVDFECQARILIQQNLNTGWYWIVSSFIALLLGFVAAHKKLGKDFGFAS